jgi:hypothetical protein
MAEDEVKPVGGQIRANAAARGVATPCRVWRNTLQSGGPSVSTPSPWTKVTESVGRGTPCASRPLQILLSLTAQKAVSLASSPEHATGPGAAPRLRSAHEPL